MISLASSKCCDLGAAVITDGATEAQRDYLTHQSYKATKSQSHLFTQ